jgi:hypothetical protein
MALYGALKRRLASAIHNRWIGFPGKQHFNDFREPRRSSDHEGRPAIIFGPDVNRGTVVEQALHEPDIIPGDGYV